MQGSHCCAETSTKVPGEHTGQTPSKATPHLSRGRPLPHVPQLLQLLASDAFWYVPSAHFVHRCDDGSMKLPGEHVTHTPAEAPPHASRLMPLAHASHGLQLRALVSF